MKTIYKIMRWVVAIGCFLVVALEIYGIFSGSFFTDDVELNGILASLGLTALGIAVILINPYRTGLRLRVKGIISVICIGFSVLYYVRFFLGIEYDISSFITGCVLLILGLLNMKSFIGMKLDYNRSIILIILAFTLMGIEFSFGSTALGNNLIFVPIFILLVGLVIYILQGQKKMIMCVRDGKYDQIISKYEKNKGRSQLAFIAFCYQLKGDFETVDKVIWNLELKSNNQMMKRFSYLNIKISNEYLRGNKDIELLRSWILEFEKINKIKMTRPIPLVNTNLMLGTLESNLEKKKMYFDLYLKEKKYSKTYKYSKLQKMLTDLGNQEESFYLGEYYMSVGDMEKASLNYKQASQYPFDNIFKNRAEKKLLNIVG